MWQQVESVMRMRQPDTVLEIQPIDSGTRVATAVSKRTRPAPTYVARQLSLDDALALDAALRLRHTVFAEELAWVPPGADGRERDRCDAAARHFAVFSDPGCGQNTGTGSELVAYARVLLPEDGLMLEREFGALLRDRQLRVDPRCAFEVSRLVVDARWRGVLGTEGRGAVEHLGRAITRWAAQQGRTEWLSVCEVRHARALRQRGLPFTRFGRVVEYQAGVPVCAVWLSVPHAAARLQCSRPADHAWYLEGGMEDDRCEAG
jgi:N-acyl-L-homoserine lactone synthetase